MCVHPSSCAARRYLLSSKVRTATGSRLRIALSRGVAIAVNPWYPGILTTAVVTEWQSPVWDVCHPSNWANEIRIGLSSSQFHRNQNTRRSGWLDDGYLASNIPPHWHWQREVCIRGPSVLQFSLAAITSRKLHHRGFWQTWIPFRFTSPQKLWPCQRRRLHPRVSHPVINHSGVHHYLHCQPSPLW